MNKRDYMEQYIQWNAQSITTCDNNGNNINNEKKPKLVRFHVPIVGSNETTEIRAFENTILSITEHKDLRLRVTPNDFCTTCNNLFEEYEIPFPILLFDVEPLRNNKSPSRLNNNASKASIIFLDPAYTAAPPYRNLKFMLGHELAHTYLETPLLQKQRNYYTNTSTIKEKLPYILLGTVIVGAMITRLYPDISALNSAAFGSSLGSLLSISYLLHKDAKPLCQNELDCDAMAVRIFGRNTQEQIEVCQEGIDFFNDLYSHGSIYKKLNSRLDDIYPTSSHPGDHTRNRALQKIKIGLEQQLAKTSE